MGKEYTQELLIDFGPENEKLLPVVTQDANTKEATETLFSKFSTPKEIAEAEVEVLEKLVYKAGFYKAKAARIKEESKILLEDYNGKVP